MKNDKAPLEITLDDVILAADTLHGDQQPVTIEAVRDMIGAGSGAIIQRHLAIWCMRQHLGEFEHEMQTLLAAGDALAADLAADLAGVQAARDQAHLLIDARDEDIERLNAELRNARQVAADALVGKARDQLAIDGKDGQLAELRQQLERNVAVTAAESDARLGAQMELVGIKTERDNLALEVRELRNQLDTSRVERGNLRVELEALRSNSARP